jgi:hypothetical protein
MSKVDKITVELTTLMETGSKKDENYAVVDQKCNNITTTANHQQKRMEVITLPDGAKVGTVLEYPLRDGRKIQVVVPKGKGPGDTMEVPVPIIAMETNPMNQTMSSNSTNSTNADNTDQPLPTDSASSSVLETCNFFKLCCHSFTNIHDLILKAERDQAEEMLVDDEPNNTKLACCVDVILGLGCLRRPDCSRKYCGPSDSQSCDVCGLCYCCGQVSLLLVVIFFIFVDALTSCTEGNYQYYLCEDSQRVVANSNSTLEAMLTFDVVKSNANNFTHLAGHWNPEKNPSAVNEFLFWKGTTKVHFAYPLMIPLTSTVMLIVVVVVMLSLGLKCQPNDPTELLYPAILEQAEGELCSYRLHRKRSMVQKFGLTLGVILSVIFAIHQIIVVSNSSAGYNLYATLIVIFSLTLYGFCILSIFTLGSMILIGVVVQIYNVTVLANSLVKLIAEKRQHELFPQWFLVYKTVIGALHVWSWRTSFIVCAVFLMMVVIIVGDIFVLILVFTTFASEPLLEEGDRFSMFASVSSKIILSLLFVSVVLIATLLFMAMISIRYERLQLLIATIVVPDTTLNSLNISLRRNAAYTLVDKPVTVQTVFLAIKLLFVQVVLLAVSAAT